MTSEIRANTLKNRVGLGTISFTNTGPIVSGIVTANSFSGPISGTTGTFSGNVDINGDLDVDGHTNLDNLNIAGVTTGTTINATTFVGNLTGNATSADTVDVSGAGNANTNFYVTLADQNGAARTIKIDAGLRFNTSTNVLTAGSFVGDGSNLTGITGVTINNNANNRLVTATGTTGTLDGESALTFNGSRLTLDGDLIVEGQSNASGEIRLVHDGGFQNHDYWMLESNKDTHAFNIKSYGTGSYVDSVTISQNTRSVGILTSNIDAANLSNPVGAGHSLVGLYIGDGSLLFSSALSRTGGYYITTGVNALNAGPVTLNSNMKLDGTWTIV